MLYDPPVSDFKTCWLRILDGISGAWEGLWWTRLLLRSMLQKESSRSEHVVKSSQQLKLVVSPRFQVTPVKPRRVIAKISLCEDTFLARTFDHVLGSR